MATAAAAAHRTCFSDSSGLICSFTFSGDAAAIVVDLQHMNKAAAQASQPASSSSGTARVHSRQQLHSLIVIYSSTGFATPSAAQEG